MPTPRDKSKPPAGGKQPPFPPRLQAKGAKELPVETLEKVSRRASENGRKAPQKDL